MKKLKLQILWLDDKVGFSVNQITSQTQLPITRYYFWPVTDAWEQLKLDLGSKPWFSNADQIQLLNLVSETINVWQNSRSLKPKDRVIEYKKLSLVHASIIWLQQH